MKSFHLLLLAVLFYSACAGCGRQQKAVEVPPPPLPPVRAAAVQRADVPRLVETVGTAKPSVMVEVRARVDGLIKKVHFKEGGEVKQGQLLFEIDSESFEAQLKEANASLDASIAQEKVTLLEKNRSEKLAKAGASPIEIFEKAKASHESAIAMVARDTAKRDVARLNLGYCKVLAPISGIAGKLETDGGSLTRGFDSHPVINISLSQPAFVEFALPERLLPQIRAAAKGPTPFKVEVRKNAQEKPFLGTISFLDNQVDSRTGTITMRAEFPNQDASIWPGEFFEVTVFLAIEKNTLTIPLSALGLNPAGSHVYVLAKDNTVKLRQLKVRRVDRNLALIDEGLNEGELVVTEGTVRLMDGITVRRVDGQGAT